MTRFLVDGPDDAARTFVFAPGAGGSMASSFMVTIARGIAEHGIRVVRFEFAYMAAGKKRPDPQPVVLDEWRAVVRELGDRRRGGIGGQAIGGPKGGKGARGVGGGGVVFFGLSLP